MKEKSIIIFSVMVLLMANTFVFSQSDQTPSKSDIKTGQGSFTLPSNDTDGPMDISATFEYYFTRETLGDISYLNCTVTTTSLSYGPRYSGYRYKHKGKIYSHEELQHLDSRGVDGFTNITVKGMRFSASVSNVMNRINCNSYNYASSMKIAQISKNANLNSYSIDFVTATATEVYSSGQSDLVERINNYNQILKNKSQYHEYLQQANREFNSKNWSLAKKLYEQASQLLPNENYPKDQLERIKDKEKDLATAKNNNSTTGGNTTNSANQNQSNTNSQGKADGQGGGNTSTTSSTSTNSQTTPVDPSKYLSKYSDFGIPDDESTAAVPANTPSTGSYTKQPSYSGSGNPMAGYNYSNTNSTSSYLNSFQQGLERGQQISNALTPALNQWADQINANNEREAQAQMQREEAEERRAEERRRKEAAAAEIAAKKRQLVAARKDLIAKYPDGKTPLSSQTKGATEVYFFVYSYQASTIENNNPVIYISNVFSVAKYADGTWPFKASLMENIVKTNKGLNLTLSGFYLSKSVADQNQQYFVNQAKSYGFTINNINYAGKKSSAGTGANTDYWGNPTKGGEQKTNEELQETQQVKTNSEVDFWGNPTKNGEQKTNAEKQETQQQKTNKIEVDFWGNPIKKGAQQQNTETQNKQEPTTPKAKVDYWGNPIKE